MEPLNPPFPRTPPDFTELSQWSLIPSQDTDPVRPAGMKMEPEPSPLRNDPSLAKLWATPLPNPSADFLNHGLELMHHYSTVTANTLALRLDMQHVWRMVVPEISYSSPFLSHGLLSVAALHKAHLLPAKRDKYLDIAAYHQTRGMEGFRGIFANIGEENWKPAFCFSSTIVMYAFSSAGQTKDAMADILQLFVLIRGLRSSLLVGRTELSGTPLSAWSQGIWIIEQHDEASYDFDPPLDHSALPLDTFKALRRLFSFYRTSLPDSSRADYEFATLQLRKAAILIAHAGPQAEIGMVMFFPYVIPANVMSDIQAKNPYALVLLSYFAVLLSFVEQQFWYVKGWPRRLLKAIELQLAHDPKHLKVTKWPRAVTARFL
ncbi:hypothetical protein MRS44_009668 [Fusarium solani]|uniref:uncharacterized protein n=1 Tax=Fusarium solani TaxID=169388 RepID=UPI0032C419BC|nr:hypothetical protein MRS44_009668 [Fusarium solani]